MRGSGTKAKIALVTASAETQRSLSRALSKARYEVVVLPLAVGTEERVRGCLAQLVIFDSSSANGFEENLFCRIRRAVDGPVLVLGQRYSEAFVVRVLRLGADDCLCRPYSTQELLARIRAHLRRHWHWDAPRTDKSAGFHIDPVNYSVEISGKEIQLTPAECRLLDYLVKRAGDVVTREELYECVWGTARNDLSSNLRLCVHNLRKKLEQDPHNPRYLMTKRGVGYYWRRQTNE
jgi:DNA-binding response OmpR family regulator